MNAGATAERVLKALRLRLMDRDIRPGDRLDPALLTSQLGASATPVREALHVLSGEGLVEARAGGGFCLPLLDEAALQDRYDWSGQLLQIALRHWPRESRDLRANPLAGAGQDPAARCAELFAWIGRHSRNSEHARAIAHLNTRLHRARMAEEEVIEGLTEELEELAAASRLDDHMAMQRLLVRYHRRRHRLAGAILRALYHRT
ncbi:MULTISPECIES: GntR family transcriptional regulator [unclassified Novosphingobium]|uniref:GntR family transcriptional regulator n=1 Tax=unclassified Novosphingobium TaxID=2644732 RepID=UPI00086ADD43|nr:MULTISPECIES: GntR family transcriptional regulator [unclassified Novosphingobium]MBN9145677.1 GntR family transcriptional regulator [Novosphingobium sp.]ODU80718.1 MAG: hypothetical protein ABT10_15970 [Novosphingobium sp. SCN 63-17]OJX87868.1 MAG: hypothetical protein BGP00_00125 [Novosphingobium sp. 63-713]